MTTLTPRETDCLNVIRFLTKDSVSPSYREIADCMDLKSLAGVSKLVDALEAKGRIRRLYVRAFGDVPEGMVSVSVEFVTQIKEEVAA